MPYGCCRMTDIREKAGFQKMLCRPVASLDRHRRRELKKKGMNPLTLALVGSVPIVTVFLLMVGLRWSAARGMGTGWVLASALGLFLWRMDTLWWAAAAIYGALQALEIILIVFGAILLMNYLEGSGAASTIQWHFTHIADDRRVQLLLIGLGLNTIIEGAAGFGTPAAIAAPLLIGLGFPPMAAAIFGLFFDATQPPFGAAGTPIIGGVASVIDEKILPSGMSVMSFLGDVTRWTGIVTGVAMVFWGLLGVFLLLLWFGPENERNLKGALKRTLPVTPFAFVLGGLAGSTQFLTAWFFGPALPDIAAGFAVLGVGLLLAHYNVLTPRRAWIFPGRASWEHAWHGGLHGEAYHSGKPEKRMPVLLAWTPYLLVALVLLVTRWPGLGLVEVLQGYTLDVEEILGQDLSFSLRYLYLPGIVPFIPVAVLTGFIHRMDLRSMADSWKDTVSHITSPAITLVIAVSMTQVMIQSATNGADLPGMMQALSRVLALGAGGAIPFVAPWIGTLGAFMTGSNTSSNILFSVLQYEAAASVGIAPAVVVAMQNVGGGLGNMLSILNIAAVCGVIGMTGMEGVILRRMVLPTLIYAVFAGLAGLALAYGFAG